MTRNRDSLLRPFCSVVVETETLTYEGVGSDDLWHVCTRHPDVGDAACGPGCVYYCGLPVDWEDSEYDESDDDTDYCVVCMDLSGDGSV